MTLIENISYGTDCKFIKMDVKIYDSKDSENPLFGGGLS